MHHHPPEPGPRHFDLLAAHPEYPLPHFFQIIPQTPVTAGQVDTVRRDSAQSGKSMYVFFYYNFFFFFFFFLGGGIPLPVRQSLDLVYHMVQKSISYTTAT